MASPARWMTAAGTLLALRAGVEDWRGVVAMVVGFVVLLVWAFVVAGSDQRTDNLGRLLRPGERPRRRRPGQRSRRMTTRTGVGRPVAVKPQEANSSSLPR